jgi:hypothetical protein
MEQQKYGWNRCNISGINDLGFWVLVDFKEYFIPFSDYPGFRNSSINQIFKIKFNPPSQLHWEELDIDIELQALSHPELFPLTFKA